MRCVTWPGACPGSPGRVFGQAGILDSARFRAFIAWETGASVKDVQAVVLGGHGDQMVSVVSATTVGGVLLTKLVSAERIAEMVERTAKGGGEVVELLGTSAWYAPGAASAQMVDAIMLDEKRVLPCTAYLEGEYGIDGLYMGVPAKLGAQGIEAIIELDLTDDERAALEALRAPCAKWSAFSSSRLVIVSLPAQSGHGGARTSSVRSRRGGGGLCH